MSSDDTDESCEADAHEACTWRCPGCGSEIIRPRPDYAPPRTALIELVCALCTTKIATVADQRYFDADAKPIEGPF